MDAGKAAAFAVANLNSSMGMRRICAGTAHGDGLLRSSRGRSKTDDPKPLVCRNRARPDCPAGATFGPIRNKGLHFCKPPNWLVVMGRIELPTYGL